MPTLPPSAPRAGQAPPTPLAPVEGETAPLDAVTFRWSAPPGASAFTLRVASADAPDAPLVELPGLPTTETTLADALPPGPTLWWVKQEGGAWSAPARFVAGTPADIEAAQPEEAAEAERQRVAERESRRAPGPAPLGEPPPDPVWPHASGPALDGAPTLDWSAVPGFVDPVRAEEALAEAEPPRPLSPLGGEIVDAVTTQLRWVGVRGAVSYEVELSPHASFECDVLALDAGAATELALPGLLPASGHQLLWRVRARTPKGPTRWSKYGRFYPAAEGHVEGFRTGLDAALLAQRKQREHARLARERELDLTPLHERPDAVTSTAVVGTIIGMVVSGLVIGLLALVFMMTRL